MALCLALGACHAWDPSSATSWRPDAASASPARLDLQHNSKPSAGPPKPDRARSERAGLVSRTEDGQEQRQGSAAAAICAAAAPGRRGRQRSLRRELQLPGRGARCGALMGLRNPSRPCTARHRGPEGCTQCGQRSAHAAPPPSLAATSKSCMPGCALLCRTQLAAWLDLQLPGVLGGEYVIGLALLLALLLAFSPICRLFWGAIFNPVNNMAVVVSGKGQGQLTVNVLRMVSCRRRGPLASCAHEWRAHSASGRTRGQRTSGRHERSCCVGAARRGGHSVGGTAQGPQVLTLPAGRASGRGAGRVARRQAPGARPVARVSRRRSRTARCMARHHEQTSPRADRVRVAPQQVPLQRRRPAGRHPTRARLCL